MISPPPMPSPSSSDSHGGTIISALHPDIIQTHILTRLDGPTLAAATCASTQFHSLSTEQTLWRDICTANWPSIKNPNLHQSISNFPAGYRSFFSDSFPLVDHRSPESYNPNRSFSTYGLISAVDIKCEEKLVFSKVQKIPTVTGWFKSSPFRVDLLDQKESILTPVEHVAGGEDEEWLNHLKENLTLSWIILDPDRNRAVNLSTRHPVSVERHWLSGEVLVKYVTVLMSFRCGRIEFVECVMMVNCGGEDGREMAVREVSMTVEDMDGKSLSGAESVAVIVGPMEDGKRRRRKGEEGKERYEEYLGMKKERRLRLERKERWTDMVCIAIGVFVFVIIWLLVILM